MAPVPAEDCRWIVHQGAKILHVSYLRCRTDDQMLLVLREQLAQVTTAAQKVRVLHDYREAFWGPEFMEESKRLSKEFRESVFERVAVVGLTGIKKALFHTYRIVTGDSTSRTFDTVEAALDWLAS